MQLVYPINLQNHRFQFLQGITVVPREIEDNGYRTILGGKQASLSSMWKWWIAEKNQDISVKMLSLTVASRI